MIECILACVLLGVTLYTGDSGYAVAAGLFAVAVNLGNIAERAR